MCLRDSDEGIYGEGLTSAEGRDYMHFLGSDLNNPIISGEEETPEERLARFHREGDLVKAADEPENYSTMGEIGSGGNPFSGPRRAWSKRKDLHAKLFLEANNERDPEGNRIIVARTPQQAIDVLMARRLSRLAEKEASDPNRAGAMASESRGKPRDWVEGVDDLREKIQPYVDRGWIETPSEAVFADLKKHRHTGPRFDDLFFKIFGGRDAYNNLTEELNRINPAKMKELVEQWRREKENKARLAELKDVKLTPEPVGDKADPQKQEAKMYGLRQRTDFASKTGKHLENRADKDSLKIYGSPPRRASEPPPEIIAKFKGVLSEKEVRDAWKAGLLDKVDTGPKIVNDPSLPKVVTIKRTKPMSADKAFEEATAKIFSKPL